MANEGKQVAPIISTQLEKVARKIGVSIRHLESIRLSYAIPLPMLEDVFDIANRHGGKPEKVAEMVKKGISITHVSTVYDIRDSFTYKDMKKTETISLSTIISYVQHFDEDLEDPAEIIARLRRISDLRDDLDEPYFGSAVKEVISISELTGLDSIEEVLSYVESSHIEDDEFV